MSPIILPQAGCPQPWRPLAGVPSMHLHRAPTPEPDEDPLPGEHPVPQQEPVPSPNPELARQAWQ